MPTDIVIAGWNHCELTATCIKSIQENTPEGTYRITYVDNGSERGPLEYWVLKPFAGKVQMVLLPENTGYCHANNIGLAMSLLTDGEHVLLLNNDTQIPKTYRGWLDRLASPLSLKKIGAVGAVSDNVFGYQKRPRAGDPIINTEAPVLTGFCLLLKKQAVLDVGLLDEQFDPDGNYSDFDYSERLKKAGYALLIAESVFIEHKAHSTQRDVDFAGNLKRNQSKFESKWGLVL